MAVLSDPISDFLTRLKNASNARNEEFTAPFSKIKVDIARILQEEGYIWNYEVIGEGIKKQIKVKTKFNPQGKPVLTGVKRCSKPGRRQYIGSTEVPRVLSGLGIAIVSTSHGVMSGAQARKQNYGGELLAFVW
ncbi:MAG: 30S ribosomal protein S8 [Akkermansia sp.]